MTEHHQATLCFSSAPASSLSVLAFILKKDSFLSLSVERKVILASPDLHSPNSYALERTASLPHHLENMTDPPRRIWGQALGDWSSPAGLVHAMCLHFQGGHVAKRKVMGENFLETKNGSYITLYN